MAAHTSRETGHSWHLPFIKPLTARKHYPEWYRYVVHHSAAWSEEPEDGLMSPESLRAWAAILPEFWAWCARHMQRVIRGVDQPLYSHCIDFLPATTRNLINLFRFEAFGPPPLRRLPRRRCQSLYLPDRLSRSWVEPQPPRHQAGGRNFDLSITRSNLVPSLPKLSRGPVPRRVQRNRNAHLVL